MNGNEAAKIGEEAIGLFLEVLDRHGYHVEEKTNVRPESASKEELAAFTNEAVVEVIEGVEADIPGKPSPVAVLLDAQERGHTIDRFLEELTRRGAMVSLEEYGRECDDRVHDARAVVVGDEDAGLGVTPMGIPMHRFELRRPDGTPLFVTIAHTFDWTPGEYPLLGEVELFQDGELIARGELGRLTWFSHVEAETPPDRFLINEPLWVQPSEPGRSAIQGVLLEKDTGQEKLLLAHVKGAGVPVVEIDRTRLRRDRRGRTPPVYTEVPLPGQTMLSPPLNEEII